jgi:ABC-2 type transport system permease protein
LSGVNWGGLRTLYVKEVRRFFKVQTQTIWAPAVTTLLFLVIFTVALGGVKREVLGVPFADFIAPGLIVMAMIQNAFANRASRCWWQDPGDDRRLSDAALVDRRADCGLIGASVTRAFLVAERCGWRWPCGRASMSPSCIRRRLLVRADGRAAARLLGLVTSIWAEKFDPCGGGHQFVVAPLSLLSGTFYVVDQLSPLFRAVSHANPFFYIISGFRYGFLGSADSPVLVGGLLLLGLNLAMFALCFGLLESGWKIKN